MIINCKCCGKPFEGAANRRYCSPECRARGIKESQRAAAKAYRDRIKQATEPAQTQKDPETWPEYVPLKNRPGYAKKTYTILEERVKKGDHLACMLLYPPTDPRHWEGLQKYELKRCEEVGIVSKYQVNGISIYTDHFPELAAESVRELKIIVSGDHAPNPGGESLRTP